LAKGGRFVERRRWVAGVKSELCLPTVGKRLITKFQRPKKSFKMKQIWGGENKEGLMEVKKRKSQKRREKREI